MSKNTLITRLCSIGVLFLCGFQGLAWSQTPEPDPAKEDDPCLLSTCRSVPIRETLTAITIPVKSLNRDVVRVGGIFGGFAQGSGGAGGVQISTANAIPHFQLRANFLTSLSLYQRFDLEGVLNTNGNRNHLNGWFSYMKRQTDFFGIGPRNPNTQKSTFTTDQRSYQASFSRDLTAHLQSGVFVQTRNTHSGMGSSTTDVPITDNFSGSQDLLPAQWIPGFLTTTQILAYGGFMEYDARDKSKDLTRGFDLYGRVASNDGIRVGDEFSDYGWFEAEFDARAYIPLASSRTSLALRSRGQIKNPKGGSQIPFYDLSYLGGREFVRGYQAYRFRGNHVLMFSTELRRTVYKKTDHRGIDALAFADTGQVWGDARSAIEAAILSHQNFSSSNWHSGVGGGIQYRHTRALAARLEIGHSNEGNQIYLAISRGF